MSADTKSVIAGYAAGVCLLLGSVVLFLSCLGAKTPAGVLAFVFLGWLMFHLGMISSQYAGLVRDGWRVGGWWTFVVHEASRRWISSGITLLLLLATIVARIAGGTQ